MGRFTKGGKNHRKFPGVFAVLSGDKNAKNCIL
jgi:hypothetical protein